MKKSRLVILLVFISNISLGQVSLDTLKFSIETKFENHERRVVLVDISNPKQEVIINSFNEGFYVLESKNKSEKFYVNSMGLITDTLVTINNSTLSISIIDKSILLKKIYFINKILFSKTDYRPNENITYTYSNGKVIYVEHDIISNNKMYRNYEKFYNNGYKERIHNEILGIDSLFYVTGKIEEVENKVLEFRKKFNEKGELEYFKYTKVSKSELKAIKCEENYVNKKLETRKTIYKENEYLIEKFKNGKLYEKELINRDENAVEFVIVFDKNGNKINEFKRESGVSEVSK